MPYFTYPSGYTNDQAPSLPTGGLPTLNPTTPAPSGYGGLQLNPIRTGYTNPFNFVTAGGTPAPSTPIYQAIVNTQSDPVPTTPAPATTTQAVAKTTREYLLDEITGNMPKALGNGGVLFNRAQLDVPNVSDNDLQFILAFLLDTPSYMGDLQAANVLLFQKEVIDDVIRGTDPQNAVIKARGAIKANIYLYDSAGNPLYDDYGKPVQTATGTPTTDTAKKDNTMWLVIGAGILLLTAK